MTRDHRTFDERAADWDADPRKVDRARTVAAAVREHVELDGTSRLLEYGAGTGLLGQMLAGDVGSLTLADPAAGMREVMHEKLARGVFGPNARVCDLDLTRRPCPTLRFDVAASLMALHHVAMLRPVLEGFAEVLVPGGVLCIADLDREDGSFHDAGFEGHEGFDREDLSSWLADAGFSRPVFRSCFTVERRGCTYSGFLAICERPT
jgi:2-polyprenyl-3-methyl-5-hydroxy-6-metoxy-1,4-benzoquinol methylase